MDEPIESLRWWSGEVIAARMETPTVRSLTLWVPGWPGHACGQHVDVRRTAPSGYQMARSYSIASPPEEGGRLHLTVERLPGGAVSPYLVDEVRVGDVLDARGPLGLDLTWEVGLGGPLLLVAGGSGIVPLMAMLRHRSLAGSRIPARFLYSVRSPDELIYRDELERMADGDPDLRIVCTRTRDGSLGWRGERRRIDAAMLDTVGWPAATRPLTYIAGSTRFVEAVASELLALGHDAARIATEWFSPT